MLKQPPTIWTEVSSPLTNCRRLRQRASLSQEELAQLTGASRNTIIRLELAERPAEIEKMYVSTFIRVSEVLGVSPGGLYPRLRRRALV